MTLTAAKVGGWAIGEILTSDQMDFLQAELLKALDGVGGGSYTLGANLTLAGAGELRLDNVLRVRTGADLFVDAGAAFAFNAPGAFNADVDFTADLTFDAAGTSSYDAGHPITYGALADLLVNSNSVLYRLDMTGVYVVESGGAATWDSVGTAAWTQQDLSSVALINIPLRVLQGDVIESFGITLDGNAGHGGVLPGTMPRIRLLEGNVSTGAWTSIFSYDDPSASAAAYEAAHTFVIENSVEPALPYTALNRLYRLEIRGENAGSAVTGLTLGAVTASIERNQLVSTNIL